MKFITLIIIGIALFAFWIYFYRSKEQETFISNEIHFRKAKKHPLK